MTTTASAPSSTTRALPILGKVPAPPAPPSFKISSGSIRAARREGTAPKTKPASSELASENHINAQSVVISSSRGVPAGAIARKASTPKIATPIPAVPPNNPSKQLSTRHSQVLLRSEEHTSELQSLRHLVCRL